MQKPLQEPSAITAPSAFSGRPGFRQQRIRPRRRAAEAFLLDDGGNLRRLRGPFAAVRATRRDQVSLRRLAYHAALPEMVSQRAPELAVVRLRRHRLLVAEKRLADSAAIRSKVPGPSEPWIDVVERVGLERALRRRYSACWAAAIRSEKFPFR